MRRKLNQIRQLGEYQRRRQKKIRFGGRLGAAAVGQEHVVDSGIDGGDLVREVTPDTINKMPHPEEDDDSSEYRCDDV